MVITVYDCFNPFFFLLGRLYRVYNFVIGVFHSISDGAFEEIDGETVRMMIGKKSRRMKIRLINFINRFAKSELVGIVIDNLMMCINGVDRIPTIVHFKIICEIFFKNHTNCIFAHNINNSN